MPFPEVTKQNIQTTRQNVTLTNIRNLKQIHFDKSFLESINIWSTTNINGKLIPQCGAATEKALSPVLFCVIGTRRFRP